MKSINRLAQLGSERPGKSFSCIDPALVALEFKLDIWHYYYYVTSVFFCSTIKKIFAIITKKLGPIKHWNKWITFRKLYNSKHAILEARSKTIITTKFIFICLISIVSFLEDSLSFNSLGSTSYFPFMYLMVSGLISMSLIYLDLTFVYDVWVRSEFISLHVVVKFSQQHIILLVLFHNFGPTKT